MSLPLADALLQCSRHAELMESARHDLPACFDAHTASGTDPHLVRATDQFVLRFIKLQDTLGEHVLRRYAVEVLGEPVEDAPLIDVLARLERFGVVDMARWARWRALRNALTHDYPDRPDLRASFLNEALVAARALVPLVQALRARAPG